MFWWLSRFNSFYRSSLFYFVKPRDSSQFRAPKAAFRRNSVITDFLVNKSIFSQTKYVVICFTPRPTCWEYEQNLFFGCCRDMFHHWEHSLLKRRSPLLSIINAWSINLNVICATQIMSGTPPDTSAVTNTNTRQSGGILTTRPIKDWFGWQAIFCLEET